MLFEGREGGGGDRVMRQWFDQFEIKHAMGMISTECDSSVCKQYLQQPN